MACTGIGQFCIKLASMSSMPGIAGSLALGAAAVHLGRGHQQQAAGPTHSMNIWDDDGLDDPVHDPWQHPNDSSSSSSNNANPSAKQQNRMNPFKRRQPSSFFAAPAQAISNAVSRVQQASAGAPESVWQQAWNCLESQAPPGTTGAEHQSGSDEARGQRGPGSQLAGQSHRGGLQPAGSHRLALQGLEARARLHLVAIAMTALEERIGILPEEASQ